MRRFGDVDERAGGYKKASRVRLRRDRCDPANPARRAALTRLVGRGLCLSPPTLLLLGGATGDLISDAAASPGESHLATGSESPLARLASSDRESVRSPIVRDFADPLIELIRLLREASEIEHALMVQYLYAAFSLKPAYEGVLGYGDPSSDDLLGVAVQEMQHLGQVNRLLVALGAGPNLLRQDFPFEPDIYPFAFNLEPLSRASLAKYVYAEAPPDALRPSVAKDADDLMFLDTLFRELVSDVKPNHLGSFYATIIATAEEVRASQLDGLTDLAPWIETLEEIKREGEEGHYQFFKGLFMGSHESFGGRSDLWDLPANNPSYPSLPLPENPSAYVGHENQIVEEAALGLAWLGNLHYWCILLLLDIAYRDIRPRFIELAQAHMLGPFWSLARHLPSLGVGMPFDRLSMGYSPGCTKRANIRIVKHILAEADRMEEMLAAQLPEDLPRSTSVETAQVLDSLLLSRRG